MQTLPASYAAQGMAAQPVAKPEAPMSLNERLTTLASFAATLDGQVFQIGTRLGVLQPVNTGSQTSGQPDNSHVCVPLNLLEASLQRMAEDLQRIRNFVG